MYHVARVGRIENYGKYKGGNLKGRDLLAELVIDGRVILKPILNGSLCKAELESAGSARRSVLSHVETVMNH
jgi:hypothetical protein